MIVDSGIRGLMKPIVTTALFGVDLGYGDINLQVHNGVL
jgi:hypothetical protein